MHERTAQKDSAKDPVKDRGFPFDEHFIMKPDRQRAEDQDDGNRNPQHRINLLTAYKFHADLKKRHDYRSSRGTNNRGLVGLKAASQPLVAKRSRRVRICLSNFKCAEEQNHRQKVVKELHTLFSNNKIVSGNETFKFNEFYLKIRFLLNRGISLRDS